MYHVAFYEIFEEEEKHLREYLPEGYEYFFTKKSIQDTDTAEISAPIISTRTQSKFPVHWKNEIEAILTRSTGYDHVTRYFKAIDKNFPAGHLPKYAARAVAEHAFMLLLMLARKIDAQRTSMQTFSRDGLNGFELLGKTLCVAGVGNIGSQIVIIGYGLEMNLLGIDINPSAEISKKFNLEYTDLQEGIESADIIMCALPLTRETDRMLNYKVLGNSRKHPILINIARGEITPPQDLARLLDDGILSGIGLDVYDEESTLGSFLRGEISMDDVTHPAVRDSVEASLDLLDHRDVICTPHNAFNTDESTDRKSQQTAENIRHYFETGEFLTPVPLD
ncbi:MAG: hydroxyacid dehydrogenase [Candidatus Marinimicrobia bacterium]|nr:hydroxyacid dehydrogenase [Candidatus Neomarinimicrobiota bacterium]